MLARLKTRLRSERGFTLIEMLVSLGAAAVIIAAVVLILDFSKTQETRISDHVAADQIGRSSVERILEELRSSCVGGMPPIQGPIAALGGGTPASPLEKLNGKNLWFVSTFATTDRESATLPHGYLHDIQWEESKTRSSTGEKVGTLTDYMFENTKGELPGTKWEFKSSLTPATATRQIVLATNVTPPENGTTLFRYYRYDTTTTDPAYGQLVELKSTELPPTTEEAEGKIAQVRIEYQQAPESVRGQPANTQAGHTTLVSGTAVLRFTPGETTEEGTTTCT
jgi:prepilin-type N-terminal cleavage/methylation domain-containing protein